MAQQRPRFRLLPESEIAAFIGLYRCEGKRTYRPVTMVGYSPRVEPGPYHNPLKDTSQIIEGFHVLKE